MFGGSLNKLSLAIWGAVFTVVFSLWGQSNGARAEGVWGPQLYWPQRLYGVSFSDTNNGWVVGDSGTILHTKDGGLSWVEQLSGTEVSLTAVCFVDSLNGWVVGGRGTILHTSDGGEEWAFQDGGTNLGLGDVAFVDTLLGWVVGDSGLILHTTDGGHSWHRQRYADRPLCTVFFLDSKRGWAGGAGPPYGGATILYTEDGGRGWYEGEANLPLCYGIYFVDSLNGWAVGCSGPPPQPPPWLRPIVHTRDGGMSWFDQEFDSDTIWDIFMADLYNGWATGCYCIFHTSNGGYTWEGYYGPGFWCLGKLSFPDPDHGWVVATWASFPIEYMGAVFSYRNSSGIEERNFEHREGESFALQQNYPNPFNATTTIRYTLSQVIGERFKVKGGPNTSHLIPITLTIYNILGEEVRTLVDERQRAGEYQVVWDGRDNQGRPVASGVYFCRLKVIGDRLKVVKTRKLLVLR